MAPLTTPSPIRAEDVHPGTAQPARVPACRCLRGRTSKDPGGQDQSTRAARARTRRNVLEPESIRNKQTEPMSIDNNELEQREFPAITDEALDALRSRIGQPIVDSLEPWCYEATRDNIRHYAHGIGDDNPLWCDPAVRGGNSLRHRGRATVRFCSPAAGSFQVMWAACRGYTPCGRVRTGPGTSQCLRNDEMRTEAWLKDLVEHRTDFAGRSVRQVYHVRFFNQRDELVAEADSWCFPNRSGLSPVRRAPSTAT